MPVFRKDLATALRFLSARDRHRRVHSNSQNQTRVIVGKKDEHDVAPLQTRQAPDRAVSSLCAGNSRERRVLEWPQLYFDVTEEKLFPEREDPKDKEDIGGGQEVTGRKPTMNDRGKTQPGRWVNAAQAVHRDRRRAA